MLKTGTGVKIITIFGGCHGITFGRAASTHRGMTQVRAFCGCGLLVNSDYLQRKHDNAQAITHRH